MAVVPTVLFWAGIELNFFIANCMVLYFGFVLKTVDNTGVFQLLLGSAYTEPRHFLLLTPPHQRVGWGCTRGWEGTQPGQLTPTDQSDVPYHMMSILGLARTGLIFTAIQEGTQPGRLTPPGQTEQGIPYHAPSCWVQVGRAGRRELTRSSGGLSSGVVRESGSVLRVCFVYSPFLYRCCYGSLCLLFC